MKTFDYRGYDRGGTAVRGLVEAESVKQARERLMRDGVFADRVIPCAGAGKRLPAMLRMTIYRELASLLDAGLPLVTALEALIAAPDLRPAAATLSRIRDTVRDGARLADAVELAGCQASAFEIALIRVAETTGEMGPVLDRLAGYMESRRQLVEGIRSALIYPAFVLTVGLIAAVTMLGILLPRAQEAAAASAGSLPALTRVMLAIGRGFTQWGWVLLVLALLVGLTAAWRLRRSHAARVTLDRILARLPIFGTGLRIMVNLRFAQALHLLLQGGVPLVEAFRMAGAATGSAWCAGETEREAEQLRHGDNIAACASRIELLRADMAGLLHTGQAGGALPRLLLGGATRLQMRWERFIKRTLAVLEPVLLLLLGGFVLLITLSVMLPLLALTRITP